MKRIAMIAAAALGFLGASAQIIGPEGGADFGMLREADGEKTIRIHVVNTSTDSLMLLKVSPTCGCTAADFMKGRFAPGDSAWIDLTYNPNRRPGHFEKAVRVYPTEGEMVRIPVTGTVLASEETIAAMFPVNAGRLQISTDRLMPVRKLSKDRKTLYLEIYNTSLTPVRPFLKSEYDAVETMSIPEELPAGDKGVIGVYLDPARESRTGELDYLLELYCDDEGPFPIHVVTEK